MIEIIVIGVVFVLATLLLYMMFKDNEPDPRYTVKTIYDDSASHPKGDSDSPKLVVPPVDPWTHDCGCYYPHGELGDEFAPMDASYVYDNLPKNNYRNLRQVSLCDKHYDEQYVEHEAAKIIVRNEKRLHQQRLEALVQARVAELSPSGDSQGSSSSGETEKKK